MMQIICLETQPYLGVRFKITAFYFSRIRQKKRRPQIMEEINQALKPCLIPGGVLESPFVESFFGERGAPTWWQSSVKEDSTCSIRCQPSPVFILHIQRWLRMIGSRHFNGNFRFKTFSGFHGPFWGASFFFSPFFFCGNRNASGQTTGMWALNIFQVFRAVWEFCVVLVTRQPT